MQHRCCTEVTEHALRERGPNDASEIFTDRRSIDIKDHTVDSFHDKGKFLPSKAELFRMHYGLHIGLITLLFLPELGYHLMTNPSPLSAAIMTCVHLCLFATRRVVHHSMDPVRGHRLNRWLWFSFLFASPVVHVILCFVRPLEVYVAELTIIIQQGFLLSPWFLLQGLISGSMGLSKRDKVLIGVGHALCFVVYWRVVFYFLPDKGNLILFALFGGSMCFLAGLYLIHLYEFILVAQVNSGRQHQERLDQLVSEKDRLAYDRSLLLHQLQSISTTTAPEATRPIVAGEAMRNVPEGASSSGTQPCASSAPCSAVPTLLATAMPTRPLLWLCHSSLPPAPLAPPHAPHARRGSHPHPSSMSHVFCWQRPPRAHCAHPLRALPSLSSDHTRAHRLASLAKDAPASSTSSTVCRRSLSLAATRRSLSLVATRTPPTYRRTQTTL
jgi:hypothetical protein